MQSLKKKIVQPPATVQQFPIVGVGASAGGLDAFKRLLKAIPENSGMAYVLVQHLDPSHESILPELLTRVTKIPVHEVTNDIHLAPDHIYIIPANKMLTSTDGVLKITPRDLKNPKNLPIDLFFTSLAEVHNSFAVGIVLSGTGHDGTIGLKVIKAHGGITFAQDNGSAAYDSMPQSAVDAGVVDFILAPEKIPEQLSQINSAYQTTSIRAEGEEVPKDDELIFKQILSLIRMHSGVDFTYYKQPTPRRRIARRMAMSKTIKLSAYLKLLRDNKAEQDALFQDMLIPVTSFFRDTKTFQELSKTVIPLLLKNKVGDGPIRAWIAGCSTGEEVYSLAISLHECCAEKLSHLRIQIFATDISEAAIKKARAGIYSKSEVQTISEGRLNDYFTKRGDTYEVNKLIRDMCVFAQHNFLKDPPFAKMDLISCRNVLIYMDTFLQKKALSTFHYALKESGVLLLGKSETTGSSSDLFNPVAGHEKIYARKSVPGRFMHVATERKEEALAIKNTAPKPEVSQTDFRKSAEATLLLKYTPAGVIVNDQMEIVHIHGTITPFLEPSPGKPTFNLLKMAREGLAFELRNALHKAKTVKTSVIKEGIPVTNNGKQLLVTIEILRLSNTIEPYSLILFSKTPVASTTEEKTNGTAASRKIKKEAQLRIQQLENELAQTREDMRSITEDQEAANEELQSANEELLSSSEEMQSLNEELETSKEELQSTNEELTIVNHEMLDKQAQLNASRIYSEAIITTIREPLIILDKALRIKTASASFYKKFNVEQLETEGKLFYEIQNHLWDHTRLRSLLEKILPEKARLEDFEIVIRFPLMGERILLLNARQIVNENSTEQLILLAIEDVTDSKAAVQKQINVAEENFLLEFAEDFSQYKTDEEFYGSLVTYLANKTRMDYTLIGTITRKENDLFTIKTMAFSDHGRLVDNIEYPLFESPCEEVIKDRVCCYPKECRITFPRNQTLTRFNIEGYVGYPLSDHTGKSIGIVAVMHEKEIPNPEYISALLKIVAKRTEFEMERTQFSKTLKENNLSLKAAVEELEKTNIQLQQFAYIASHDLHEPLRKIMTFSKRIQEKDRYELHDEVKVYLDKIEIASGGMRVLIDDLLNYSRLLDHEKLFEATDLDATLESALKNFEVLIEQKKAEINAGKLPTIEAIPFQMRQLFYNLIGNALKFSTEQTPPVISIAASLLSEKQVTQYPILNPLVPYYEIIFKDNGIGFEQKYGRQIFAVFQRLHNKQTYSGTGIGLALSKKIVENHSGEIFAESKENEGAAFHIILPLVQPR
ncbi:MAG: signal transduction histidine kinase with CheB and CheR [Chitinophagaceae bacterium]|nr:signal transduction histidine kinase with CheB and CheR [Chitinophagaceae bacterium]